MIAALKSTRVYNILLVLLLVFIISACKSQKSIQTTTTSIAKTTEVKAPKVFEYNNEIKDISLRFTATLMNKNVGGQLKAIKDSVILISLQPLLGIEIARIKCTPDTIYMIDRFNRKYGAEPIDEFAGQKNAFFLLQSALCNFIYNKAPLKNCIIKDIDNNTYIDINDGININYALINKNQIQRASFSDTKKNINLLVEYDNFATYNEAQFPNSLNVLFMENKWQTNIIFKYRSVSINTNPVINWYISSSYQKTSISDYLKLILK